MDDTILDVIKVYTIFGAWFFLIWIFLIFKGSKARTFALNQLRASSAEKGRSDSANEISTNDISALLDDLHNISESEPIDEKALKTAEIDLVSAYLLRENLSLDQDRIAAAAEVLESTPGFEKKIAAKCLKENVKERTAELGIGALDRRLIEDIYQSNFKEMITIVEKKRKKAAA